MTELLSMPKDALTGPFVQSMNGVVKSAAGRGPRADWSRLIGRTVEVWRQGELLVVGIVDQATPDDRTVWIAADGCRRRKLYDKSDGCSVWA
ncbi:MULTISPECIES: hypothetical protein [Arthrobacter]|uniref:Transposase n=2 Tax=Arthrobacter TaxID=1663 RepID=A0ABU9KHI2_9MICC|nr:hypothetical protein [Arthrobacter sp. YJM1]MDP5225600.1 hypothetical protein [Arthrobacter sp. YJM1]